MPRTLSRIRIAAQASDPAWYAALPAWGVHQFPASTQAGQGPAGADYSRQMENYGGGRLIDRANIGGVITPGPFWTNAGSGGHANTIYGLQGGVDVYGPLNAASPQWHHLRAPFRAGQAAVDWWTANREPYTGQTMATPSWGDGSWIGMHTLDCGQLYDSASGKLVRIATIHTGFPPGPGANMEACWGGTLDFTQNSPAYTYSLNSVSAGYVLNGLGQVGPTFMDGARGKVYTIGADRVFTRDIATNVETFIGAPQGAMSTINGTGLYSAYGAPTAYDPVSGIALTCGKQVALPAYWIDVMSPRALNQVQFAGDAITSTDTGFLGPFWNLEYAWGYYWLCSRKFELYRIARPANPANAWTVTKITSFPTVAGFGPTNPVDYSCWYRGQFAACASPKGFVVAHPVSNESIYFVKVP